MVESVERARQDDGVTPPQPRSRRERFARKFPALAIRDFRLLVAGSLAAGLAQWAQSIGIGWLVFDLTGSSGHLGGVALLRGAVSLLSAPWGGVLLDRMSRRRVLVLTTALGGAQAVVLAALVLGGWIEIWHTYLFALIDGLLSTTNQTARSAVVYDVTTDETLPNAVALNTMSQNLARIVGPPLIGALIGFTDSSATAFVSIAVMATLATWLTLLLRSSPRQQARAAGNPLGNLAEGLRYSRSNRAILGLLVITFIPLLLVTPYVSLLPVFAEDVLHSGALGLGLLASALGWGSIIGLLVFTVMGSNPPHRGTVMLLGLMLYLSFALAFTQSTDLWLSFTLLVIAGVFNSIWYVLLQTLIQLLAADEVRGRVLGVWQMALGAGTLGVLPMGLLAAEIGVANAVALFIGTAWVLSLLVLLTWRSLRTA